mgnify:CR=1 FL=1
MSIPSQEFEGHHDDALAVRMTALAGDPRKKAKKKKKKKVKKEGSNEDADHGVVLVVQ